MQKTLDSYGAGIQVQQVQLQKVDPPAQVIDAFRDVQAARSDLERAQNEAQTYANRVVPEARGRAAKITQDAEAYREQTVAEANGQTSRFLQVYDQYKKAPDVTRERMYLETMERVLGGTDKTIIDTGPQAGPGVVPYLPLTESAAARGRRPLAGSAVIGRQSMKLGLAGGAIAVLLLIAAIVGYSTLFTVNQTKQALVVRLGKPVRVITEPGPQREGAVHRQRDLYRQAHSRPRIAGAGSDRLADSNRRSGSWSMPSRATASSIRCKFYQTVGPRPAPIRSSRSCSTRRCAACSARPRSSTWCATSASELMAQHARPARSRGAAVRHSGRRRAHPPRRPAGAEQPGGLPAHADRAAARGGRVPRPRQPEEPGNPRQGRPRRHRARWRTQRRRPSRSAARATANATASSPRPTTAIRTSSPSTARCRPTKRACSTATRAWCCRPDSDFFRLFLRPVGPDAAEGTPSTPRRVSAGRAHAARAK